MGDSAFDDAPHQPMASCHPRWQWFGLGVLLTIAFTSGFLLARWVPQRPAGDTEPLISSLIQVDPIRDDLFGQGDDRSKLFEPFLQTQVELVRSSAIVATVLANSKVSRLESVRRQTDAEAWLRENLKVAIIPGTFLIRISATDMSPEEQVVVLNEVVAIYLAVANASADSKYTYQIKMLDKYEFEITSRIKDRRNAILELESAGPDRGDERSRQVDGARIRFIERDLRPLEELRDRAVLAVERLKFESQGEARINQISVARLPKPTFP
jgi:hypothetical protein